LGEKSRIDDAAKNSYSIGTIHIRLAIHVFHQGTCDDNNLNPRKRKCNHDESPEKANNCIFGATTDIPHPLTARVP
jgi:hypothetical protein